MKFYFTLLLVLIVSSLHAQISKEQVISVKTAGETIYGTLLSPENAAAQTPVVLIIAGSGPTDRNGNDSALGLNGYSYRMLADSLAKNGIASLRYDKRLSGKSMDFSLDESKLRFDDFVNDADNLFRFLKTKYSKIYIIGHSEGSLTGILLSQKEKPAGFISVAGAGENIALTLKRQLSQVPDTAEVDSILTALQDGHTVNTFPAYLNSLFRKSVQPYLISWMKYDPQKEIAKLHCPVLILQGTHDIQVTVKDAKSLKMGKPGARLVIIDSMNHIFKNAPADKMKNFATYADPSLPINSEFASSIVSFIKQ